jgi:hypothetical protein
MVMGAPARGSDDKYCSAYPPEPHHYIGHSVSAEPIGYVDRCSLCSHISSSSLRRALEAWRDVVEQAVAYYRSNGEVDDHNALMDAVERLERKSG